jgi:hypothetical protein
MSYNLYEDADRALAIPDVDFADAPGLHGIGRFSFKKIFKKKAKKAGAAPTKKRRAAKPKPTRRKRAQRARASSSSSAADQLGPGDDDQGGGGDDDIEIDDGGEDIDDGGGDDAGSDDDAGDDDALEGMGKISFKKLIKGVGKGFATVGKGIGKGALAVGKVGVGIGKTALSSYLGVPQGSGGPGGAVATAPQSLTVTGAKGGGGINWKSPLVIGGGAALALGAVYAMTRHGSAAPRTNPRRRRRTRR